MGHPLDEQVIETVQERMPRWAAEQVLGWIPAAADHALGCADAYRNAAALARGIPHHEQVLTKLAELFETVTEAREHEVALAHCDTEPGAPER